jgi:membrane-associated phospholipid phosphatase
VVLSLTGPRGRRAVARGTTCSLLGSALHLPIKRVVRRPRPRGARAIGGSGPLTSSFPSGHTASDLGFLLGASQELPLLLLLPGSIATACSHWSLIRTRKHYPSDVIAGGALAVIVTVAAWKLRPPLRAHRDALPATSRAGRSPTGRHAVKRAAMRFVTNQLLNRLTRLLLERGLWPRTQALIETTGRVSGLPRRVPVGTGCATTPSGSSPSTATAPTTSATSSLQCVPLGCGHGFRRPYGDVGRRRGESEASGCRRGDHQRRDRPVDMHLDGGHAHLECRSAGLRDPDPDPPAFDQAAFQGHDVAAVKGGTAGTGAEEAEQARPADREFQVSGFAAARAYAGALGNAVVMAAFMEAELRLRRSRKQGANARAQLCGNRGVLAR